MINKTILESSLLNKFNTLTLHAIVNEAFINGLPFSRNDLTNEDIKGLTKYSLTVLEALGGAGILTSAYTQENDSKKKLLLTNIIGICTEASKEATKRIVDGVNCKEKTDIAPIVDSAAFTKEEYNSFIKSADTIGIDKISQIIKDKTIKTIKSEKEAYDNDEQIQQELSDALTDSTKFKDTSLESYMDLILDKSDTRGHISLFSKLQDISMEALLHSTEEYNNIPIDTIKVITLENTLEVFSVEKSPVECLEALILISDNQNTEIDKAKLIDASMVSSIIIYGLLETLKTMNIYNPTKDSIKKFIEMPSNHLNIIKSNANNLYTELPATLTNIRMGCLKSTDPQVLSAVIAFLKLCKEDLNTINGPATFLEFVEKMNSEIDALVGLVAERISSIGQNMAKQTEFSPYDLRLKDETIAQLNKINTLFSNNPNVKDIRLCVDPKAEDCQFINVECRDASDAKIDQSFVPIKYKPSFGSILEYVRESFNNSKLATTDKNVYVYCTDGSCSKINLK